MDKFDYTELPLEEQTNVRDEARKKLLPATQEISTLAAVVVDKHRYRENVLDNFVASLDKANPPLAPYIKEKLVYVADVTKKASEKLSEKVSTQIQGLSRSVLENTRTNPDAKALRDILEAQAVVVQQTLADIESQLFEESDGYKSMTAELRSQVDNWDAMKRSLGDEDEDERKRLTVGITTLQGLESYMQEGLREDWDARQTAIQEKLRAAVLSS